MQYQLIIPVLLMAACFDGPRDPASADDKTSNTTQLSYKDYEPNPDNLCLLKDYSDINLLSFGDFSGFSSDVEGRAYAKGDVYVVNYAVGEKLSADEEKPSIVSNASVRIATSGIFGGPVYYADDFIAENSNSDIQSLQQADYFNFDRAKSSFINFAEYASSLTQNTEISVEGGDLRIEASGDEIQVAKIDANTLNNTRKLDIISDTDKPLLIVVSGDKQFWGRLEFNISEGYEHKVFFVFPDSQEMWIDGLTIFAHIIAPNARLSFSDGQINGNIAVKEFLGQGQVNISYFPDLCYEEEPPCEKGYECDIPDQNN